jgi:hypothetical protein
LLTAATAMGCSKAAASTPTAETKSAENQGSGFAVVELFPSEGCSSCPPADDVLRELASEATPTGKHVYPLAFHVDYWNGLGWPDPYSSEMATARQQAYSRALGEQGVYTPEMIINGRDAFVGSNRTRAHRSIEAALSKPEANRIVLHAAASDGGVSVDFAFSAAPTPATVLQVAFVQKEAVSQVKVGENAGRSLRHANVVRALQTVQLDGSQSGHTSFRLRPTGDGSAIIAYLQDPETMAITSAARVEL